MRNTYTGRDEHVPFVPFSPTEEAELPHLLEVVHPTFRLNADLLAAYDEEVAQIMQLEPEEYTEL